MPDDYKKTFQKHIELFVGEENKTFNMKIRGNGLVSYHQRSIPKYFTGCCTRRIDVHYGCTGDTNVLFRIPWFQRPWSNERLEMIRMIMGEIKLYFQAT